MIPRNLLCAGFAAAFVCGSLQDDVKSNPLFTCNAALQQQQTLVAWGIEDGGETVLLYDMNP